MIAQRTTHSGGGRRLGALAVVLAAGLTTGLTACGDDDADMDDVDVTTDVGMTPDSGMTEDSTTMTVDPATDSSTDLTTGGTATGDTPVSGSVSNDSGGAGTVAP